ncbi:MAG: RHS repeat-associated core domain-containing protein, partial [Flammeovirgaceae bacterium]
PQRGNGYSANNLLKFENAIQVSQTGYVYIWVSNESENTEVWFDDLNVVHQTTLVAQATDYETWGGVLREQKWEDIEGKYRYGYQGKYAEKDDETGWEHFELREYDAVEGRWKTRDPKGQYFSPYVAMGNNPISTTDPDGGFDWFINNETGQIKQYVGETSKTGWTSIAGDNASRQDIHDALKSMFGFGNIIRKPDMNDYLDIRLGQQYEVWKLWAANISLNNVVSVGNVQTTRFKFDLGAKPRNWNLPKLNIKKFDNTDFGKATADELVGYATAYENKYLSGKIGPLHPEQAVYFVHQLERAGAAVRADKGHLPPNPWWMPHLNVGAKGVHVPFK